MVKFDIGDIICKDESSVPYAVNEIDEVSGPMPKYKLTQGDFSFWDYCIGWKKLVTPDDVLRYGEVLTDESILIDQYYIINELPQEVRYVRIRTIRYEYRIFYHKMVNGEVVEFKELTI